MKFRIVLALVAASLMLVPPANALRTHRGPTSGTAQRQHSSQANSSHRKAVSQIRGQRGIDPARATEIQQALIRENYMSGEPTGQWDSTTEAAMVKYQSDHGWQTKLTPDSRALIKLGLGPRAALASENGPTVASN